MNESEQRHCGQKADCDTFLVNVACFCFYLKKNVFTYDEPCTQLVNGPYVFYDGFKMSLRKRF